MNITLTVRNCVCVPSASSLYSSEESILCVCACVCVCVRILANILLITLLWETDDNISNYMWSVNTNHMEETNIKFVLETTEIWRSLMIDLPGYQISFQMVNFCKYGNIYILYTVFCPHWSGITTTWHELTTTKIIHI